VSGPTPASTARPLNLQLSAIGLGLLGGTAGTATRGAVSLAVPEWNGVPLASLGVTVTTAVVRSHRVSTGRSSGLAQQARELWRHEFRGTAPFLERRTR
jgi:hypothetical protein